MADITNREIPTRTQAIKDFCLMHCQKKDKDNSKRSVAHCLDKKCPLHPYRTGALHKQKGEMSDREKKSWAKRLEAARKQVTYAENNLKRANTTLEFRRGVFQVYVDKVEEAKNRLENAKKNVRDLEVALDEALRGGKWK